MRTTLLASAAALALTTGHALAQDLLFTPGEGAFNWASFEAFAAAHDLSPAYSPKSDRSGCVRLKAL